MSFVVCMIIAGAIVSRLAAKVSPSQDCGYCSVRYIRVCGGVTYVPG
jgi:hypothetical protein